MKTTFTDYLLPRYLAYIAGMKAQAASTGFEFKPPTISQFLSANAILRDEKLMQRNS